MNQMEDIAIRFRDTANDHHIGETVALTVRGSTLGVRI